MFMKQVLLIAVLANIVPAFSQTETEIFINDFDNRKNKLQHDGMVVLGSWASANIIGSAIGYGLSTSNEEKEFYIMNGSWGLINLGLALPALLTKPKPTASLYDLQRNQTKFEKIFLANAVVDVAYIAGGFYLKEYASNQSALKDQERFNGFGNAIILQGAGLMAFDIAMTLLTTKNRRTHLDSFLKKTYFSFSGNSLRLGYRF
jgi:MFS family permease